MTTKPSSAHAASAARRAWLMSDASGRVMDFGSKSNAGKGMGMIARYDPNIATLSKRLALGYGAVDVLRRLPYISKTGRLPGLLECFPYLPENLVMARAAIAVAIVFGVEELEAALEARAKVRSNEGEMRDHNHAYEAPSSAFAWSSQAARSGLPISISPARREDGGKAVDNVAREWVKLVISSLQLNGGVDVALSEIMNKLRKLRVSPSFSKLPSKSTLPREIFLLLRPEEGNISLSLRRRRPSLLRTGKSSPPKLRSVPREHLPNSRNSRLKDSVILDGPPMMPGVMEMLVVPDERTFSGGYSFLDASKPSYKRRSNAPPSYWMKLLNTIAVEEEEMEEGMRADGDKRGCRLARSSYQGTISLSKSRLLPPKKAIPKNNLPRKRTAETSFPSGNARSSAKRQASGRMTNNVSMSLRNTGRARSSSISTNDTSTVAAHFRHSPIAQSLPRRSSRLRKRSKE